MCKNCGLIFACEKCNKKLVYIDDFLSYIENREV